MVGGRKQVRLNEWMIRWISVYKSVRKASLTWQELEEVLLYIEVTTFFT